MDINEQPLSEVSVIISGTTIGTTSDSLGYYKLSDSSALNLILFSRKLWLSFLGECRDRFHKIV